LSQKVIRGVIYLERLQTSCSTNILFEKFSHRLNDDNVCIESEHASSPLSLRRCLIWESTSCWRTNTVGAAPIVLFSQHNTTKTTKKQIRPILSTLDMFYPQAFVSLLDGCCNAILTPTVVHNDGCLQSPFILFLFLRPFQVRNLLSEGVTLRYCFYALNLFQQFSIGKVTGPSRRPGSSQKVSTSLEA